MLPWLALGATLGAISILLPPTTSHWVELITSGLLMPVGLVLLYHPEILHKHTHNDHDDHRAHDHAHDHEHEQHNSHRQCNSTPLRPEKINMTRKWLALSLFAIGFVNMIIPCPTAAVMYGYALNSGNAMAATMVFGSYALSTALAVGLVIYCIFKITTHGRETAEGLD